VHPPAIARAVPPSWAHHPSTRPKCIAASPDKNTPEKYQKRKTKSKQAIGSGIPLVFSDQPQYTISAPQKLLMALRSDQCIEIKWVASNPANSVQKHEEMRKESDPDSQEFSQKGCHNGVYDSI